MKHAQRSAAPINPRDRPDQEIGIDLSTCRSVDPGYGDTFDIARRAVPADQIIQVSGAMHAAFDSWGLSPDDLRVVTDHRAGRIDAGKDAGTKLARSSPQSRAMLAGV
ncbi:hypothetical protein [Sphingomonas sp.]|uniref:hypothetical protein n=1 Tax=Sphingomonas sp. TaxID=28214 RepID=UPI001ED55969|nr:hypothetical protein [Sphingomonas sp.]MBX3593840.1 hypothetical protein [Sphingomonas sp.]